MEIEVKKLSNAIEMYAVYDEDERLIGLIDQSNDKRWKVQLLKRFVHFEPTRGEAFAWARDNHDVREAVQPVAPRRD